MLDDKNYFFIMRHAKSDQGLADISDFDRPLNDRGEHEPTQIALELNDLKLSIDKAIISSSRRTMDTWLLLEKKLVASPSVIFDRSLYNASFQDALDVVIEEAEGTKSLMMIGHNPSVSEIYNYLVGELTEFKPATCAVLSCQESLVDALNKRGGFKLEKLITAK